MGERMPIRNLTAQIEWKAADTEIRIPIGTPDRATHCSARPSGRRGAWIALTVTPPRPSSGSPEARGHHRNDRLEAETVERLLEDGEPGDLGTLVQLVVDRPVAPPVVKMNRAACSGEWGATARGSAGRTGPACGDGRRGHGTRGRGAAPSRPGRARRVDVVAVRELPGEGPYERALVVDDEDTRERGPYGQVAAGRQHPGLLAAHARRCVGRRAGKAERATAPRTSSRMPGGSRHGSRRRPAAPGRERWPAPSPAPPPAASPLKKGSKMRGRACSGIPMPESSTRTTMPRSRTMVSTRMTFGPAGSAAPFAAASFDAIACAAFMSRFTKACPGSRRRPERAAAGPARPRVARGGGARLT